MIQRLILRWWYGLIHKSPLDFEMVQYWKHKEAVLAKLTKAEDGSIVMQMEGEKYPFPTFPRGHLLFGPLSKLKHEIKDQIFNDSWWALERGDSRDKVRERIKQILREGVKVRDTSSIAGQEYKAGEDLTEILKYEVLPRESMTPSVREIHRAWTRVAPERTFGIRDYLCLILQEDDGYRFRLSWLVKYFNPNSWFWRWFDPVELMSKALTMVEHAEVITDMKERVRLFKRILLLILEDKKIHDLFIKLVREIDWKKVALTKADAYYLRGKYFKADMDVVEY